MSYCSTGVRGAQKETQKLAWYRNNEGYYRLRDTALRWLPWQLTAELCSQQLSFLFLLWWPTARFLINALGAPVSSAGNQKPQPSSGCMAELSFPWQPWQEPGPKCVRRNKQYSEQQTLFTSLAILHQHMVQVLLSLWTCTHVHTYVRTHITHLQSLITGIG